jgi:hypothetical protein
LQVNKTGGTVTQYQNGNLIRQVTGVSPGSLSDSETYLGAISNGGEPQFNGKNSIKYFVIGGSYNPVIFDNIIKNYLSSFTDFEIEYVDILNYAKSFNMTLPSLSAQTIQNQLIVDLKNAGIWDSLDRLFVYINDIPNGFQFAGINWKNPTQSTEVSLISSPTYTNTFGFAHNGSTGYVNTNFNPVTNGVNFTISANTICVGYDNTVLEPLSGGTVYGSRTASGSGDQLVLIPKLGTWRHESDAVAFPDFTSNQLSQIGRLQVTLTGGTVYQYQNSDLIRQVNVPSPALANTSILNCALRETVGNVFYNGRNYVKYFAVGAPFNAVTFDGIINTYLTSMSSFEPEYLEVLNFAAKSSLPIPTRTIQVKQNQIVASLKSSGIWNSLDRFYVYTNDAFEGY